MADSVISKIISAHKHPKEIASYADGFGVAKQLRRLARRDARKLQAKLVAASK
jgi:hypothetical protein